MKSNDVVKLAKLGLQGDKKKLIKLIEEQAAEASNKNKLSLYRGLQNLIEEFNKDVPDNYPSFSSFLHSSQSNKKNDNEKEIWLSERTRFKIDKFLQLQKHTAIHQHKTSLNKLLLYGPPGTGKTTLGFYIADRLSMSLNYVKVSDVVSAKFGETTKNIANIFKNASEEIVFIDEFDAFAKSRTDSNDVGELKRIVNSLIQTLDFYTANKIVIVATNLIESLDSAILRRFPYKLLVDELDKQERRNFFQFAIKENKYIDFRLTKDDLEIVENIITGLDLKTVDAINQLIEKTVITTIAAEQKVATLVNIIEAIMSSDYVNSINVKDIYNNHPKAIKNIAEVMEQNGYKIQSISKLLGIHRNSYDKYVKQV